MSLHVIVGAGPVGAGVARLLVERGDQVRVVTRHGTGLAHPSVERIAADAADAEKLASLVRGASTLFNCASPQYHRWLTDWPPLASSLLAAAERSGAVLATASNLYGHGRVQGPITNETPLAATHPKLKLRADIWRDALAAHRAGRVRATEVRGSDYPEANSVFSLAVAQPLLAGKRAFVPSPLDVPHSWTSIRDVARTLVAVATDERAWGKAWLVPTHPPLTMRQLAERLAKAVGAPPPKLTAIPYGVLWTAGLASPLFRELRTTWYQFEHPFVVDSSATERTFGLAPTALDEVLAGMAKGPVGT
ncbi:saccharopine dehydrogenase NADP-binding domain-containing protein [Vulgatibacter incomptus]|uniref:Nucleoside-diphosphate-sugar epimerase n=1 Tax=Vulgatibacter incomptus TaxID=1391653 RepID=A0A0K1PFW5_9BACT|nr:saccharopine dehydrogenase NADP-binding domain-containing protein [Vulgatibacter incomptus]AKU92306.1 Nucleoside-diphosphate-sugar epimerase [Vulgatibacter incomptus]